MNPNHIAAFRAIEKAQQALRQGDKLAARECAVQAAQLAPDREEPWLMMAALAAPRASVAYLNKALAINPQSERARKGMEWAVKRLREQQEKERRHPKPVPLPAPPERIASAAALPRQSYTLLLILLVCAVSAFVLWQGATPALALINGAMVPAQSGPAWGVVNLVKPTYTLTPTATFTPTNTFTPSPTFTASPTATATFTPTDTPSPTPPATETPLPTATDVPYSAPTNTPYVAPEVAYSGERWIEVNLSQQMLYAWEGDTLVASFVVSTGTWQYPTVTGSYRVYARFKYKDMSGPGYYLPKVPNTMFFYQGYAIHGTYWHNNFGTPMSHGCVNMTIPDSEWLYNWSPSNVLVNVHY
jgi:lipoprotein-anchoring transpeptidase ErfK/SrfK